MRPNKPKPDLELYFPGRDVYPEKIPVRYLADALSAIHRLATPDEDEDESEAVSIRLVDIVRGSAVFRCVAEKSDTLISRLRTADRLLQDPKKSERIGPALPSLRRLCEIASALGSPIVVRNPVDRQDIIATIHPHTYETLSSVLLVSGEKSISGNVQRVGGATGRRCLLRVPSRKRLVYCDVSDDEVARILGQYLYQEVNVSGTASWLRNSWEIVSFTIHSVRQPEPGSLTDAFAALRAAGGDGWDKISEPERYRKELCGER